MIVRVSQAIDVAARDPYVVTFTGERVSLRHPEPSLISAIDIEHALARIQRFTGHGSTPYSVADHSVLTATIAHVLGASLEVTRWALFHDASEAYIGDVSRPLKSMLPEYRKLELSWQLAIAERFALVVTDVTPYDRLAMACECAVCGPALTRSEIGALPAGADTILACAAAFIATSRATSFAAMARGLGVDA